MDQEHIKQEIARLKQIPQLRRRERRYLEKLESKLELPKKNSFQQLKRFFIKTSLIVFVLAAVGGSVWYFINQPNLPPIDAEGHIEQNAPHISDREIPDAIQRHMIEHADGNGVPGIVIQYNCKKYSCEKNLVGSLRALAEKYPKSVFLAPGNYDGKIILTRLGRREVLSSFNQSKIVDFITQ